MQAELLAEICDLHGDNYSRAIIDRAGAEIPRIEMAGNNDDLLGMFGAFEIGDDVVAGDLRKRLRSENEMHRDSALRDKVGDGVCIFRGDGGSGNSCRDALDSVR